MLVVQGIYDKPIEQKETPDGALAGIEIKNPDEIPLPEKRAALQRLMGIAAGSALNVDDIKAARLERQ